MLRAVVAWTSTCSGDVVTWLIGVRGANGLNDDEDGSLWVRRCENGCCHCGVEMAFDEYISVMMCRGALALAASPTTMLVARSSSLSRSLKIAFQ